MVGDRTIVATCLVPERAGDPRLADPGRADDQQVLLAIDPVSCRKLVEQRAVQTARGTQIDILDDRLLAQRGQPQPRREPLVLALHRLAVEQQRQPFLEAEGRDIGLPPLLVERLGHAGQAGDSRRSWVGWASI